MADTIKILGQANFPTTDTVLVTGVGNGTTISSLVICNTTSASLTFTIWVNPSGGTNNSANQAIYYQVSVPANDTFVSTIGITLAVSDTIHVLGSATGLNFTAFGVTT